MIITRMETSSLEEQALKRKDKLKALKRKRESEPHANDDNKGAIDLPK